MNPFIALLKREWWEYRSAFLVMPITLASLLVFLAIIGLLGVVIFSVSVTELPAHWQSHFQSGALVSLLYGISILFISILWLTVLSYFWNCLYSDRKDGSILFWQSMPVSQTQSLLAKLVMGLLIVPFVSWLCFAICELFLLTIIGLALYVMDVPAWAIVWQPGVVLLTWLSLLIVIMLQGLWLFPLVGWLMCCSAFAKRAPLLVAIMPVAVVVAIEYFVWMHSYLYTYLRNCLNHVLGAWGYFYHVANQYAGNATEMLSPLSPWVNYMGDLLLGFFIGIIFLIAAGVLRNRCYGIER